MSVVIGISNIKKPKKSSFYYYCIDPRAYFHMYCMLHSGSPLSNQSVDQFVVLKIAVIHPFNIILDIRPHCYIPWHPSYIRNLGYYIDCGFIFFLSNRTRFPVQSPLHILCMLQVEEHPATMPILFVSHYCHSIVMTSTLKSIWEV